MSETLLWSLASFMVGSFITTLTNIAIFKSALAVLTVKLDIMEKSLAKISMDFERFREEVRLERDKTNKYIADTLLKVGAAKRWGDEKDLGVST